MSLILDGATETQDGQDYIVHCPHARWPMYYENGYVIELHGVVKARCRTVSLFPIEGEGSTPSHSTPSGQALKPEPSSSLGTSPSNNPANADTRSPNFKMDIDVKPNGQPIAARTPYIVKIEELFFDNEGMRKYVDVTSRSPEQEIPGPTSIPQQSERMQQFMLPAEPPNMYGMPTLTMRTLELAEGSEALMPLMGYADQKKTNPISAIYDLVQQVNGSKLPADGMVQLTPQLQMMPGLMTIGPFGSNQPMYLPPGMMNPAAFMAPGPGGPPPSDLGQGSLPEGDIGYSTLVPTDMSTSRPPTTINPSTLSSNGSMANGPPGTSNAAPATSSAPSSTSALSLSPTLPTKSKRGTMPSSPTKGDKDKTGNKRRNTGETAEPASKRVRVVRKGSKAG